MNAPFPMETARLIAGQLRALGVRRGGVLLVHSSLKSLGRVPGGPETVIHGLLEVLGPTGTLLMPALTYERVTPAAPVFDVRRTPANVGAIPEYLRTRSGTLRSVHPTHSVCGVGALVEELLEPHALDSTPCGPRSPFRRLPECAGQILMLGCGLEPNTSMHAVEELVEPPYLFAPPLAYRLVLDDGSERERVYVPHDFAGWVQRYGRIAALLSGGGLKTGTVLAAGAHLIEARAFWNAALAALRENPLCFVEKAGRPSGDEPQP